MFAVYVYVGVWSVRLQGAWWGFWEPGNVLLLDLRGEYISIFTFKSSMSFTFVIFVHVYILYMYTYVILHQMFIWKKLLNLFCSNNKMICLSRSSNTQPAQDSHPEILYCTSEIHSMSQGPETQIATYSTAVPPFQSVHQMFPYLGYCK